MASLTGVWLFLLLPIAGAAEADYTFRQAEPNYHYRFPRDYFGHPEYRTEWWYYTGNLTGAKGEKFGFELVFFRQGEQRGQAANPSAWRVDDLYLAHAAITDINGKRFLYSERLNRKGPGVAGVSEESQRVWNGNWRAQWNGALQTLSAVADDFRFELTLDPATPPIIHGVNGVSQKADGPGRASHYVSIPRLNARGTIRLGDTRFEVSGLAWMDHEWFTEQLAPEQRGWDWFSAQLEDNTEVMLFDLRRKDGSADAHSSGTFIDQAGVPKHLTEKDFTLKPIEFWKSFKTGATYPVKWKIQIPSLGIELECKAAFQEQELTGERGLPAYWEGAVVYSGSRKGVGYLEMTGYDRPVDLNPINPKPSNPK